MGFFSFLEPQQEQEPAKGYVPEGWQVRRKGKDYWENDQTEAGPDDELREADKTPKATPEEMDPAGTRRKFASDESSIVQKEQSAIRKVQDILRKQTTNLAGDYGNAQLHQVSDALNKGMLSPDQLSDDLQTILKGGKLLPATVQQLSSAANDLKLAQMARQELESRRSSLTNAPTVDPSVYAGHSNEAFEQARKLREEVKGVGVLKRGEQLTKAANLEAQGASLKELSEQGKAATEKPVVEAPVGSNPVGNFMKGLGIDEEDLSLRLHAALNKVGIPKEQWGDQNVDTAAGLMRILSEIDPQGIFARLLAKELADARQEDYTKTTNTKGGEGAAATSGAPLHQSTGQRDIETEMNSKEARMRELYAELRQTPFMRTWPGMILYVLVGILTQNPAFAARLIGGVGNRAAVDAELRGLQFDLKRLDHRLSNEQENERYTRREAATRLQRERDRDLGHDRDIEKMYLNHKLILERAKQNASTSNRPIVQKLEGDYNRVMRQMSESEKIMNNTWLPDDDPKKIAASREYNQLKGEAKFLDQKLRSLTEQMIPGTYTDAEKP